MARLCVSYPEVWLLLLALTVTQLSLLAAGSARQLGGYSSGSSSSSPSTSSSSSPGSSYSGGSPPSSEGSSPSTGGHSPSSPSGQSSSPKSSYSSPPSGNSPVETPPTPVVKTPPTYSSPPALTPPVVSSPTPVTPVVAAPISSPVISTPIITGSPISSPGSSSSSPVGGTCDFWKKHLALIPKVLSGLKSLFKLFGNRATPVFGSRMTVMDALFTSNTDGYSLLAKQGTTALLNSYSVAGFPYTPKEIREDFEAALESPHLASLQAALFEQANTDV